MPSMNGITPGFLLQDARFNNQQSPYAYDPSGGMVDPTAALQYQQQYAKQLFAMQNPRLALPQQFGAALGAALTGQRAGGAQAPTQPQGGPQTPVAQDVHNKYLANMKGGMDQGEALYKASQQSQMEGKFANDPTAEKVYDKATTWAIEKYKYDPNIGKSAKASAQQETENLVGPDGQIRAFRKGTPEWQQAIDSGQFKKASDTPQLTPGSLHEVKIGGRYVTYKVGQDGSMTKVGTSSQPMQYQVSGTPDQMAAGGLLGTTGTTAGADKARKELSDRQIATVNGLRALDSITDTIKSSAGSAVGKAGDWYEHGNNIVQTARNLAGNFGQEDLLDPKTYNWKGLDSVVSSVRGKAIDATKYHSQMVAAAYAMAAAQSPNNTDEKMTRQRVEANLEILAEHSADPQAVIGAISGARQQLKDNFATQSKVYDPSYTPAALNDYEYSRKPKGKGQVGPYSDAEKEARYQEWLKKHPR